jgi:hypothetical protein
MGSRVGGRTFDERHERLQEDVGDFAPFREDCDLVEEPKKKSQAVLRVRKSPHEAVNDVFVDFGWSQQ